MNKYHSTNSCKDTGNIDKLLFQYKEDRDSISEAVIHNPEYLIENLWTHNSPIAIDKLCNCSLGHKLSRTKYCCAQCSNLKKIADFRNDIVDNPFIIEYGEKAGEKLMIVKHRIGNLFLKKINPNYILGDNYTIRNIIIIMFQKYYNDNGYNITPYLYTSFVCGNSGYSLHSVPTIGTYNMLLELNEYFYFDKKKKVLKQSIAKGIIIQLYIILQNLVMFNFSHGTPCSKSLLFNGTPFKKVLPNDNKIECAVSLQIANLWNASAEFEGNYYSSMKINEDSITSQIEVKARKYKLNSASSIKLTGTYDFYCFITSLMCKVEFYNSIHRDSHLKKLWMNMWDSDDFHNIERNLNEIHKNKHEDSYSDIAKLLSNKWLKYDILEEIFTMLPNII